MIISKLDKQSYAGKEFVVRYTTNGYYDIERNDSGFQINYKSPMKVQRILLHDLHFIKNTAGFFASGLK